MDWKPLKENKWLMVLAVLGVLFLIFGSFLGKGKAVQTLAGSPSTTAQQGQTQSASSSSSDSASSIEQQTQDELTKMLDNIEGIQSVSVMITYTSTGSVEVANNTTKTETTSSSGNSLSTTESTNIFTETNSSGDRVPYVVKRTAPTVQGVLVTVQADDFYLAREEIIDAITNVLDVPAYKITVEPQKAG